MAIVLGIDPGSRITGYGIIKIIGVRCCYVASGCIRLPIVPLPERLQSIYDGLSTVIQQHGPDSVGIERVFMARNADSALKLGQARGAAIVTATRYGLAVAEYSARQIKQAVVGKGAADKYQVQHMVKSLLNLNDTPQADAADALAVALCHAHTQTSLINRRSMPGQ